MRYTLAKLRHLDACLEAICYVEGAGDRDTLTLLRGAEAEWVLWLAPKVLPTADRRVVRAASACARAVMHKARPEDVGVITSTLDLVDRWCAGEAVSVEDLRAVDAAAWASAAAAWASSSAAAAAAWAVDAAAAWASAAAAWASASAAAAWASSAAAAWAAASAAARHAHCADLSVDLYAVIDAALPLEEIAVAFDSMGVPT